MWQDAASLRFKIFTFSKFFNAFGVPSMLLVCQLEILLATPFGEVVHPSPFRQDYQLSSLRFLGTRHSDAVLLYLTVPLSVRIEAINVIAKVIFSYC